MILVGKTILLISSERWGKVLISKHHYARALSEKNIVFFLNPVSFSLKPGQIKIAVSDISSNLFIVTYRPFFPWFLKFHVRKLYRLFLKLQVERILIKIGRRLDIVWDMNCSYLYPDLSYFQSDIRIFHPVDRISPELSYKAADVFFTVSPFILEDYKCPGVPKYVINHGLSKEFEHLALSTADNDKRHSDIVVGYIGNLLIPSLDRVSLLKIISCYPNIRFTFMGPYDSKGNNIYDEYSQADIDFIADLRSRHNVELTGTLSPAEIAKKIIHCDAFLICYKTSEHYRMDNSHKILEYLSTGKVIISSSEIRYYSNTGMIEAATTGFNLEVLFEKVISNLEHYNSREYMSARKKFAASNTYASHINKIDSILTSIICEKSKKVSQIVNENLDIKF